MFRYGWKGLFYVYDWKNADYELVGNAVKNWEKRLKFSLFLKRSLYYLATKKHFLYCGRNGSTEISKIGYVVNESQYTDYVGWKKVYKH